MPPASSPRRTVMWLCGFSLTTLGAGWLVMRYNAHATLCIDTTQAARVEEHARYRCTALPHYDVVVRNYYLPCTSQSADTSSHAALPGWHVRPYRALLRWWHNTFSNDRGHAALRVTPPVTAGRPDATGKARHADMEEQSSVRLVVHDAAAEGVAPLASATWPAGTQKYCALVLEPSGDGDNSSNSSSSSGRERAASRGGSGFLRGLLDTATQQSLVKCDARNTATAQVNCAPDPRCLAVPYTRVLLAAFLLLPDSVPPSLRVGMLGVGGGAMAGFVQHHFSRVLRRLDLVDVEPMCLVAAVRDMGLSDMLARRNSGEVRMYAMDAAQFLRDQVALLSPSAHAEAAMVARVAQEEGQGQHGSAQLPMSFTPRGASPIERHPFDVLLVDLFCGSRLAGAVTRRPFLQLCQAALAGHGVVAFNLPTADADFVHACRGVFGEGNVIAVPVPRSANVVVLARNAWHAAWHDAPPARVPPLTRRGVYRRVRQLQERDGLPYDLASHLPWWWRL